MGAYNVKFLEISQHLGQVLDELQRMLEFIVAQLKQTRFAGKYREMIDKVFEKELIRLIDRFSEFCMDTLRLTQHHRQMDETRRLFEIIETLLQSCLIVRHPHEKSVKFGEQVTFYKHVLKTNSNLKFQVDFFAPRLLKDVKGKLTCKGIVVNERIAEKYQKNPDTYNADDSCGTLTHTTQTFSEDGDHHILTAKFARFTVSNISRAERKNTDIVTDEKVVFVFHAYFKFQNRDIDVSFSISSFLMIFNLPLFFVDLWLFSSGGNCCSC